jgi:hypothetical protein
MRKIMAVFAVMAVGVSMAPTADAAKPKTVWEDAAGDADLAQGTGHSIPAGFDLAGGAIAFNKGNLEFTVTHHDMPPAGSAPEAFRFIWNITVDGEPFRFTVKSVDIGKPDAAAGQTTERVGRVDAQGHFRLEGECVTTTTGIGFVNCPPLEYLEGFFDPAAKSFTIIVPLKSVGAKTGSTIVQGASQICNICWVSHYAERSLSPTTVIDDTIQTVAFKVPKK